MKRERERERENKTHAGEWRVNKINYRLISSSRKLLSLVRHHRIIIKFNVYVETFLYVCFFNVQT